MTSRLLTLPAVLFLLTAGLAARLHFTHANWDEGQHLNPDERFLSMVASDLQWPAWRNYFNPTLSTLNPQSRGHKFFVYGTAPLFLTKAVAAVTGQDDYDHLNLVGRTLAALCNLLTLGAVFFIAARLYGFRTGYLAAIFFGVAPLTIQLSHFFIVDSFATLGTTVTLLAAVAYSPRGWGWVLLSAVAGGVAIASKINALPVLFAFPLVWAVHNRGRRGWYEPAVWLALTFVIFRTLQPYAFAGPGFFGLKPNPAWLANFTELRRLSQMTAGFPPNLQWELRPWWFGFINLAQWGMGPLVTFSALIGMGLAFNGNVKRPDVRVAVIWLWTFGYFLLNALASRTPTLRYLFPIYPTIAIFAAWFFKETWENAADSGRVLIARSSVLVATAFALFGSIATGLAFHSIYQTPNPRVAASRWIYEHVPRASTIASESAWDDILPLPVDGKNGYGDLYMSADATEFYAPDNLEKALRLTQTLKQADYFVISSNRQWASLLRLKKRFPLMRAFYLGLLDCNGEDYYACFHRAEIGNRGKIGFELAAEFESYPQLFGVKINDQSAEEAFTVYDHPRVLIFRKTDHFNEAAVQQILKDSLDPQLVFRR